MHLAAGNLYRKFKWHCVGSGLGPILRDWVNWRHFRLSFLSARFFNLFVRYTENNFKKLWSFRSANVSAPNRRNMPLSLLWRRLLVIFFSGVTWRDICCVTHAKLGFMQNDLTLRKQKTAGILRCHCWLCVMKSKNEHGNYHFSWWHVTTYNRTGKCF